MRFTDLGHVRRSFGPSGLCFAHLSFRDSETGHPELVG